MKYQIFVKSKFLTILVLVLFSLTYVSPFNAYAKVIKIKVTSQDFNHKGFIIDVNACSFLGQEKSPQLSFSNAPPGTQSFALIMFDPDAPDKNFVHWVIYNIPVSSPTLNQNIPPNSELEGGIKQGKNGTGQIGYLGPCPPPLETHRYVFNVYALDTILSIESGSDKKQLQNAMKGHIIGKGKLVGKYKNNTSI